MLVCYLAAAMVAAKEYWSVVKMVVKKVRFAVELMVTPMVALMDW